MKSLDLRKGFYRTVEGKNYRSPKQIWGFRTPESRREPFKLAKDFLQKNHKFLKLERDLRSLHFRRSVRSLGAWHFMFEQRWHKLRIHRAYVSVHIDNKGRVYLVKNRAMPYALLPQSQEQVRYHVKANDAWRHALSVIKRSGEIHLSRRPQEHPYVEKILFPVNKRAFPAYGIRLYLTNPRAEYIVYIKASEKLPKWLQDVDNLAHFNVPALVFDPNPPAVLGEFRSLLTANNKPKLPPPEAYRLVTLKNLRKRGFLEGPFVKVKRRPKQTGPPYKLKSSQRGFEEVMAYYHIRAAMSYLRDLGFRIRALFRKPLMVEAYGSEKDNSWYSPGLRLLTFGYGGVDDAEDAEVILHEFGHALQDAICPDFGRSREAAAVGEGFGDYLAASFFAQKKPLDYQTSIMSWDRVTNHHHAPPCARRVDEDLKFDRYLDRYAYEHQNGKIWSATLWDIWLALGREKADRLIIESLFQLDGFTTFADAARAILDADCNLYDRRYEAPLLRIFRHRRIGPLM